MKTGTMLLHGYRNTSVLTVLACRIRFYFDKRVNRYRFLPPKTFPSGIARCSCQRSVCRDVHSRDSLEALLAKMPIYAKSRSHTVFPHHLKAHTVHYAQFLAARCKNGARSGVVLLRANPCHSQERCYVFIKSV